MTPGNGLSVGSFFNYGSIAFSPDGQSLLFDHTVDASPESIDTQNISRVDLKDGSITPVIETSGIVSRPMFSNNGRLVAFETSDGPYKYYGRDHIAVLDLNTDLTHIITRGFPENAVLVGWNDREILFRAVSNLFGGIYAYNYDSGVLKKLTSNELDVELGSVSQNGNLAVAAGSAEHGTELFFGDTGKSLQKLTELTAPLLEGRISPKTEVIKSTSSDGNLNLGTLYLPPELDSQNEQLPLVVIVHGGPKQVARPERVHSYVYPVQYWIENQVAVFMPNYRGSAGFGDSYRAGSVGDFAGAPYRDIVSGIDTLIYKGVVDPERIGIMGWSNGGFLTAYSVTQTERFVAASVGAGISDWNLQFYLSDDPNGAEQYLEGRPWEKSQIYLDTSPLSFINKVKTPVLIQHGAHDSRVPLANAEALFRGLRKNNVASELWIFEGEGHFFSSPKQRYSAAEQNRRWFDYYLLGKGDNPTINIK